MTDRTRLDHLSSCYGIALEYTDIWGRSHPVSETTQRALLAAMGVPAETEADLECALADYERRAWGSVLAPVQVVRDTEDPFGNPGIRGIRGIRGHHTYFYSLFVGKSGGEFRIKR
jgi:hypothetical protein